MHDLFGQSFRVGMRGVFKIVPKRSSFTIFCDYVVGVILADGFVHLDDVWVILWNYYFFDKLRNTNRKKLFLSFLLEKLKYQFLEDVDLVDQFLLFFL